jgi:PKD repeat protein
MSPMTVTELPHPAVRVLRASRHRSSAVARRWPALFVALAVVLGVFVGAPSASAAPGDIGYEGASHTGTGAPTGTKRAESVLWFNDGKWWANMWDTSTNDFYIFSLRTSDQTWVRTNTKVDTRANSHSDVLWDGSKLYIASHLAVADGVAAASGFPSYLYRYSYNTTTDTYSLDTGYPSRINNMKTETLTIDKDSTGVMWATWMQGNAIYVNRSLPNDQRTWSTPAPVPGAPAVSVDDNSSVIAYNDYVGIMWSSQSGAAPDGVYFAVHRNGAADTAWSAPIVAYQAPKGSDDHMNLKWLDVSAGQIYAAVKTSFTTGTQPLLQLLVFDIATGKWRAPYTIARQNECPNRVILLIDEARQLLRTFATYPGPNGVCSTSGGAIYEKSSPLGNISFPASKGKPVMLDADSQFVHNVSSTKQNIKAGMGVVVLADNNKTMRYWHFYEAPGGTAPATAPTAAFTATQASSPALTTQFTDTSTGSPTSWAWDFGDNSTSTATSPSHTYAAAGTYTVTLTATNTTGSNTASKAVTVTAATSGDTTPPDTAITSSGPTGTVTATSASFAFTSSETGSTFQCKLDAGAYAACTSPKGYTGLAAGSHTFSVQAKDAAGNLDATPATRTWTIGTTPGQGATLTPVADTWVGSDATSTNHGAEASLYSVTGTPTKVTYLKFDLTGISGTVSEATLTLTTTTGSSSGSPSAQDVYSVADTTWSETAMTYANAPVLGSKVVSIPGGSAPSTAYAVTIPASVVQAAVGKQLTLAVKGAAADAFYVNSREAASGRPQLVVTAG